MVELLATIHAVNVIRLMVLSGMGRNGRERDRQRKKDSFR